MKPISRIFASCALAVFLASVARAADSAGLKDTDPLWIPPTGLHAPLPLPGDKAEAATTPGGAENKPPAAGLSSLIPPPNKPHSFLGESTTSTDTNPAPGALGGPHPIAGAPVSAIGGEGKLTVWSWDRYKIRPGRTHGRPRGARSRRKPQPLHWQPRPDLFVAHPFLQKDIVAYLGEGIAGPGNRPGNAGHSITELGYRPKWHDRWLNPGAR